MRDMIKIRGKSRNGFLPSEIDFLLQKRLPFLENDISLNADFSSRPFWKNRNIKD
jgi:hypothetical protein